jgi:hypothetical protein
MIISVLVNKYTPAIFDIIFLWVLAAALIMVTVEIHSIINGSSVLLSMN